MNQKLIALLTLCSVLCLANASWAQNITWQGNVGNFNVGTNWVGGVVPGSANTAIIAQNNAVVTLDTTNTITALSLALNAGNNTSSMLIDTNGSLTVTGTGNNLWIGQAANNSPTGTLTVKGTLNYSGHVLMSSFQNAGTTAKSSLIIDGGTVFIDQNLNLATGGASTTTVATFTLTNGGTISGLNNISTGSGTNIFNLSTISTGIDVVNMSGTFTLGAGNNILNVDLSSYDTNSGTSMNLFTFGSRSGSWSSVNIDGIDLGSIALSTASTNSFNSGLWSGNFVVSSGSLSLTDLEAIPEPSTYALLALAAAGLGAHVVRRRKR